MCDSDFTNHKTDEFTEKNDVKMVQTALPSHLNQTILYCKN